MVLGCFNPHFNLGAIVRSSTRPEKTKILYFLCFCDCFFFSLKKWKNAKSACSGHRPEGAATRQMVNQYQTLFFMDRTNILTTWLGGL